MKHRILTFEEEREIYIQRYEASKARWMDTRDKEDLKAVSNHMLCINKIDRDIHKIRRQRNDG